VGNEILEFMQSENPKEARQRYDEVGSTTISLLDSSNHKRKIFHDNNDVDDDDLAGLA